MLRDAPAEHNAATASEAGFKHYQAISPAAETEPAEEPG
ncbi:MAG: hypothetical protein K0S17_4067 [Enterobacter mori]|nr:hypothetical protein [Enterobacter mori]